MLVLGRKTDEAIVIDGKIKVVIVAIQGQAVKLGIEALASIPVHRSEVWHKIAHENSIALTERK